MSLPDLALANQALRLLGAYGITGFDEGTDLAATVAMLQPTRLTELLTAHPWRFTLRKQRLARLADAPLNEWTHAHQLPAECVMLRAVRPDPGPHALPADAWEVWGDQVLSHHKDLWADFQVAPPPSAWPPWFMALAQHALAAHFAIPVGAGSTAAEYYTRLAFGTPSEARGGGLMGAARRADSQQNTPQIVRAEWLRAARFGGR
jgi:hypothetical protein